MENRLALRVDEAARAVGISPRKARYMVASGEWPHRSAGRAILIPTQALRRWLEEKPEGGNLAEGDDDWGER
jgi:excisionase family DNA binding protein